MIYLRIEKMLKRKYVQYETRVLSCCSCWSLWNFLHIDQQFLKKTILFFFLFFFWFYCCNYNLLWTFSLSSSQNFLYLFQFFLLFNSNDKRITVICAIDIFHFRFICFLFYHLKIFDLLWWEDKWWAHRINCVQSMRFLYSFRILLYFGKWFTWNELLSLNRCFFLLLYWLNAESEAYEDERLQELKYSLHCSLYTRFSFVSFSNEKLILFQSFWVDNSECISWLEFSVKLSNE